MPHGRSRGRRSHRWRSTWWSLWSWPSWWPSSGPGLRPYRRRRASPRRFTAWTEPCGRWTGGCERRSRGRGRGTGDCWRRNKRRAIWAGGSRSWNAPSPRRRRSRPVARPVPAVELGRDARVMVQRGLASLGFSPGPADGDFGPRTRAAVGAWQEAKGYQATGALTQAQADALVAVGEKAEGSVSRADEWEPGRRFRDCAGCPELVVVPAGSFMMGSRSAEIGRNSNEGPQHRVRIANPFAVGMYEVTFAQWDACRRDGGCTHSPGDGGWGRGDAAGHERELGRRAAVRSVAVEGDGEAVSAVERVGVGVRGAGRDADTVPHRRDDIDGAGQLRRELHVWLRTQGTISKADGGGGFVPGERIRVA